MKKNNWIDGKAMSFQRWKTLLIMKLLLVFILGFMIQSYAVETQAQTSRLNIRFENNTLKEVFQKLKDQSEFSFVYKDELINSINKVSGNFKDEKVTDLLDKILRDTGLTYMVKGRAIVILPSNSEMVVEQQKTVTGKVTDSSGSPLPGVSVVLKGSNTGTVTDTDGKYSLANIPANATLQFSFVGMKTKEVLVQGKSTLNTTLEDETIGIEEVVAVGYGSMKKSDLTGSISSVKTDALASIPVRSATEALQGKVAGVTITSTGGSPGSAPSVRIRGIGTVNGNDPLYVVDGFPQTDIGWLNQSDIASMEILKDASAEAIYGSRGANGVIILTTKKGVMSSTHKMNVNLDMYYGVQNVTKKYDMDQWK